jgi:hypothetical protein
MTRKDYQAIAGAIAQTYAATSDGMGKAALVLATQRIADVMGMDNQNFDRSRFMQAALPPVKPLKARVA